MNKLRPYRQLWSMTWSLAFTALLFGTYATQVLAQPAINIDGKAYSVEELAQENQGRFYEIEQKKFDLIQELAREKYFERFFQKLADQSKVSLEQARTDYLSAKSTVTPQEIKDTLSRFKDHPALKDRSEVEKNKAVSDFIKQSKVQDVLSSILAEGQRKKQWEVLYAEPKEPLYQLTIADSEPTRYGPPGKEQASDCQGNKCPITIVEYSDFQCPFCERALPAGQQVMQEYQGKVRWIVRDFPLDSHGRAKPAAIAAQCAKGQGKYWEMYGQLFRSQKNLSDSDLKKAAQSIGLDEKAFGACLKSPEAALAVINANLKSGEKLGVTGTPTFFINGRRLSGAVPFAELKRVIDSSLANKEGQIMGR